MAENKINLQTLIFVRNQDEVLLGMKRRGFGTGMWHGYWGKIEPQETLTACAKRELYEESQLIVEEDDLKCMGFIQITHGNIMDRRIYIYVAKNVTGVLIETEEMSPRWFKTDQIPYDKMWDDTHFWLPLVLKGTRFEATFAKCNNKIISIQIDIKGE